jgi:hypothetical protein
MNIALHHFIDGGFGMYPTLLFGVALLAVAGRYATRPEKRYVPLLIALNILTVAAGALGFVTGVITTTGAASEIAGTGQLSLIALVGVGESLNNVAFALLFVVAGAMAVTLGAWRIAREAV